MKKVLSLLTLVVMLMAPNLLRAEGAQIFFLYKYNGALLTNEEMNNISSRVTLYKNGEQITYSSNYYDATESQYLNAKQEITLSDDYKGQSVAYVTQNGMRGTFTISDGGVDALDLNLRKLTIKNLSNTWVYIYNAEGNQVASVSGYYSPDVSLLLPPADGYYYEKDDQRIYFDLSSADKEIDWSEGAPAPVQTKYTLRFVGHYGDFPLPKNCSWYLYKYGDQQNYINSIYSGYNYVESYDAGNYWLRDEAGHWSEKIELDANKTVFLPYQKVTFVSKTAGVPTTSGNVNVRAKSDGGSYYYYSQSADFNNKGEAVFYLQPGDYTYSTSGVEGEFTVGNKDEQVNINKYKVTITVQDANGKREEGAYVNFADAGNSTDENGQVVFEVGPGTFTASASLSGSVRVEKEVVVTNANAEATVILPALVTFNVYNEGKPYDGGFSLTDEDGNWYSGSVDAGVAKFRLLADKDYYLSKGTNNIKVHITEGCTINMGYIEITSEGMGIAFPRSGLEATTTLTTIVGGVVRLTAIPVIDEKFQKWTINGTDYTDPMIDFTIKDPITKAKAVFDGSATNRASVKQEMTTINVKYDDQFVYFSADVEGSVSIYNIDGKLVKSLGVIGDRVGIYDLPQGSYVLTLTTADGAQTARFQKK